MCTARGEFMSACLCESNRLDLSHQAHYIAIACQQIQAGPCGTAFFVYFVGWCIGLL
jgi:hypothetical protein